MSRNSWFKGLRTPELVNPSIFPYDAPYAEEKEKSASHHFVNIFFLCAAARKIASEWPPEGPEIHQKPQNFNFWTPSKMMIFTPRPKVLSSTFPFETTPVEDSKPSKMIIPPFI